MPLPPESNDPMDELSGQLRKAVEEIRNEPAPQDALVRSIDRVESAPIIPIRRNRIGKFMLALGSLAAAALIAVGAWYAFGNKGNQSGNNELVAVVEDPSPQTLHPTPPANPATSDDPSDITARTYKYATDGGKRGDAADGKYTADPTASPASETTTRTSPNQGPVPTPVVTTAPMPSLPQTAPSPLDPEAGISTGRPASPIGTSLSGLNLPPGLVPPSTYSPSVPGPVPPGSQVPGGLMPADPRPGEGKPAEPLGGDSGQGTGVIGRDRESLQKMDKAIKDLKAITETVKKDQQVVTAKTANLAQSWGRLAEKERADVTRELTKSLTADQKKAVVRYLDAVAKNEPPPELPPGIALPPVNVVMPPNAEGPGSENYNHFLDNPYQAVSQQELSTFSITVDTASYSNVRRFLTQENRLPPADAVRVAELINYFPYKYAQPEGEHPVTVTSNMVQCPWNPKHHLLRVALKAKEYHPATMPPRNFVFLLDTSGSMNSSNKLPLLIQSLELLVENLTDKDRVAIVVYAGSAGLVLPSTSGGEKETILNALKRLRSGGSTNGGAGIQLAYKIAQDNFIKGGLNRVILGSDGDFNVGTTSQGELVRLIEEKRKTGVYLSILGYGMGNLKDSTMEQLARHGNGQHAYIDTLDEAKKLFVEQGAALVTVAKDVKLQLEFNPQMIAGYRLIGYENRMLQAQDFNDDTKDASEMGAGHTVTALYEVVPAGLPVPKVDIDPLKYQQPKETTPNADSGEWLTVKLRYKDPEEEKSELLEQPLTGAVVKFDKAPDDFRFAAAVASFGMLLRKSEYAGSITFDAVKEIADGAKGDDPNGHRAGFLKLVEKANELTPKK